MYEKAELGSAVAGMGLRPLACWYCGLEKKTAGGMAVFLLWVFWCVLLLLLLLLLAEIEFSLANKTNKNKYAYKIQYKQYKTQ